MRAIAAALVAIAIAIVILAGAVFATRPYHTCSAGGGGLPTLTYECQ